MLKSRPRKITPGMALRIIADVLMVQFSLMAGLWIAAFSHLLLGQLPHEQSIPDLFWATIGQWGNAGWSLTLISLAIFYLNGFYTYGRFYQGKYKALIVFQAVCQSYLVFGFVTYFLHDGQFPIPR